MVLKYCKTVVINLDQKFTTSSFIYDSMCRKILSPTKNTDRILYNDLLAKWDYHIPKLNKLLFVICTGHDKIIPVSQKSIIQ